MRRIYGFGCTLLALGMVAACTVKSADSGGTDDGGAAGSGGEAGNGGSGGEAGTDADGGPDATPDGDADAGPCGDVPTTGRCTDATHLEVCVVPEGAGPGQTPQPPYVKQATCGPQTACQDSSGSAKCVTTTACLDGTSACETGNSVKTCQGGNWVTTSCGTTACKQKPGYGAFCAPQGGGSGGPTITGHLSYEYQDKDAALTGFNVKATAPAAGMVAVAYDSTQTFVGSGYVENDGSLAIQLDDQPNGDVTLYFFPMTFDQNGRISYAVAKWGPNANEFDLDAGDYWSWGVPIPAGTTDMGDQIITEDIGSGAVNVFEYQLYGLQQAASYLGDPPQNLLALWEKDKVFGCGNSPTNGTACFYNNAVASGGVDVKYAGGSDHFDTAIAVPGTSSSPKHWSASVLLHELGHYMMDSYSRSPGVGGTHYLDDVEVPALAWSEGWATFHGQHLMEDGLYFTQSQGTFWYVDVDKFDDPSLPKPNPALPMDQKIGEIFVASSCYHLWSSGSAESTTWENVAIDDQLMWNAFHSAHLTDSSKFAARGYDTPDLVDFLDGLKCAGASQGDIDTVMQWFGFPYDGNASCP